MARSDSTSAAPSLTADQPVLAPRRRSEFEKSFGQFADSTIEAAEPSSQGLMRELNQIHQIVGGLGAVLRIVEGNGVMVDNFDPQDPDSIPPLSRTTEGLLTTMAAVICERLGADIELLADHHNERAELAQQRPAPGAQA